MFVEETYREEFVVTLVAIGVMVMLIMLCAKRKKQHRSPTHDVQLVSLKYSDDQQNPESSPHKSNGSSVDRNSKHIVIETQQRPHSLSSASTPNENRTLPTIPSNKAKVTKRHSSPLVSTNVTVTKQKTSASTYVKTSPKGRQLPDLPPNGIHDASFTTEADVTSEGAYESLEMPATVKTVTNDNDGEEESSVLYDTVSNEPQEDEDENDLYAQVGDREDTVEEEQEELDVMETEEVVESSSNGSLNEAVTYASIDKTKKMSIRRDKNTGGATASNLPTPPPIPVRNFDMDDSTGDDALPPPSPEVLQDSDKDSNSSDNQAEDNSSVTPVTTSNGPAYDTLCVRESFAHQRLREEVAENQRNRYANMQTTPGLYAQIEEQSPEAVYESVSQPNSADGTVTRPSVTTETSPDDDYSSIDAINQSNHSNNISTNHHSFYENVVPHR